MKAPVWYGVMDPDGKLHLDAPKGFAAYKQTLKNSRVEVTIRKAVHKRSKSQNAFWWSVVVPMFADACGYTADEHDAVHDELMRVLMELKEDGHPALKIRQSSGALSTEEFNVLIEQAQIFGATKLGIVIPDPDKEWKQKRATKRQRAA